MIAPTPAEPGATPVLARVPAPDLARGAMLLLIALANAHVYLYDHPIGARGYPADLGVVDQAVVFAQMLLVDGHAYPLFALLFGYGITQLVRRRAAVGLDPLAVVGRIRRRGAALVLIGFTHALLLWSGDMSGAYGLVALLLAPLFVIGAERALLLVAGIGIGVMALLGTTGGLPVSADAPSALPSITSPDALQAVGMRAFEWVTAGLFGSAFAAVGAVALGAFAAWRGLLDEPARHRRLLTRVAVVGLGGGVLMGLPFALFVAEIVPDQPSWLLLVGAGLHTLGGYLAGAGYAAVFGLWVARTPQDGGAPTVPGGVVGRALVAVGRRSLSCYLAQSVAFVLLPAWSLGLGAGAAVWQVSLYGLLAWVVIAGVAVASERMGLRGPAEAVLRTLTYGSTSRTTV